MKPKIPKLTKKERREWIKALKGTLKRYKNGESHTNCLLCGVAETRGRCGGCIWRWFTDTWCIDYRDAYLMKYTKDSRNRIFRNPRWIKLRLRQIPRWIKKLEEEL